MGMPWSPTRRPGRPQAEPGPIGLSATQCRGVRPMGPGSDSRGVGDLSHPQQQLTVRTRADRLPLRRPGRPQAEPGPIGLSATQCRAVRPMGPGSDGRGDGVLSLPQQQLTVRARADRLPLRHPGRPQAEPGPIGLSATQCRAVRPMSPGSDGRGDGVLCLPQQKLPVRARADLLPLRRPGRPQAEPGSVGLSATQSLAAEPIGPGSGGRGDAVPMPFAANPTGASSC